MAFELPDLPYDRSALEPYMSARTLEFHHGKHHQAYVTTLNNLVKDTPMASMPLEEIVRKTYNDPDKAAVFNNASQHWNHTLFWPSMRKGGSGMPSELENRIKSDFGSVDKFKEAFIQKGVGQFGSGWAWLVEENGKLVVTSTPNGVNPLCFSGQNALLGCDVWEHSYYLDYQNRRPDYIKAFLDNLVNWEFVASRLSK